MKRAWLGVALLASGWVLGTGYLQVASYAAALVAILAGIALLSAIDWPLPERRTMAVVSLLLLPSAWLMPGIYKVIPLLMAFGLGSQLVPISRRWAVRYGQAAVAAGGILLSQAVLLWIYAALTARTHDLPWPLTSLVAGALRLMGLDVALTGSQITFRALQQVHHVGATWELLLDPVTACFLVGGLVMLALATCGGVPQGRCWPVWRSAAGRLLLLVAVWLPLRIALLVTLYLNRLLVADAVAEPNVASVLVNTWLHIALLTLPALLSVRFLGRSLANGLMGGRQREATPSAQRRLITAAVLVGLALAIVTTPLLWDPVGQAKQGRVMVVERHSTWEPTTEPYGTKIYGEEGSYNYAAAFDYLGQFYRMSRLLEAEPIDDQRLDGCDVLIIKTPTARYTSQEVDAVVRFVQRGGGLLVIGDHTNVFNMNTYLNDITRHFGFSFRDDLLFRAGSPYYEPYQPSVAPHPVVQAVAPMTFAVSCSIDPGWSLGRMVIRSKGLWSLPPAYQEINYHPQAEYGIDLRAGAFCQLWSTTSGSGRVLAFGDSTLFSNFCTFQEGKLELLVGMLEWLNHQSPLDRPAVRLALLIAALAAALAILGAGLWRARGFSGTWVVLVTTGLLGWTLAAAAVTVANHRAMPLPPAVRPRPQVVIDRNVSAVPFFTGAFADDDDQGEGAGYGMLEQWIPRLGFWMSRQSGDGVFAGDALVVICPTRSVTRHYREQLIEYVRGGGKVLVFDSPDSDGSTANSLLWPFGLASDPNVSVPELTKIRLADRTTDVELQGSCEITGGAPIAWLDDMPVAATVHFGRGSVTAIGFGSLFNDANMGYHWLPEPSDEMRARYDLLYDLLRAALGEVARPGNRPVAKPTEQ